ncbi:MAG TPA: bile acid:sodium symporter [Gemmataceae bacterium]|nr:bile acid:sodium symporter [Gemmataceae bacterium]
MLKAVVDVGVPILVFVAMTVVGTELTSDDFRRVARQPGRVVAAILGQMLLLPVTGWLLVRYVDLQPEIRWGVLLVTACPSGGMANVYAYLGRGNVALSVTLTAMSCLAALIATPLALSFVQASFEEMTSAPVPLGVLTGQLVILLALPVFLGMGIRFRWPDFTRRHGRGMLAISVAALVGLLGLIIAQEAEQFAIWFTDIAVAVGLLTPVTFAAGWGTGWVSGAPTAERFTVGMVFVVRNVGIATAIAVTVLGRVEFAVFATAYFLAQVPVLLAVALVFRSIGSTSRSRSEFAARELFPCSD